MVQNEFQFRSFLSQAKEIFNIAVYTISSQVILGDQKDLTQEQVECVKTYYQDSNLLINLVRHYLDVISHDTSIEGNEGRLIRAIHFISKLYFSSIEFIREFYNLGEEKKVLEIWR